MAVTNFSPLLGLALPTTGDLSGTWGTTVNDAITNLIDSAVAGTTTLSANADVTLSTTNGASNQARSAVILWTASNGATIRYVTAPAQSKAYVVINAGTGTIVVRGTGPTTGVIISSGTKALVAWNGSDFVNISSSVFSGVVSVEGTAASGAAIRLYEDTDNGTNYIALQAPASLATNVTLTLPDNDGANNQVLKTDGSGVLSWTDSNVFPGVVSVEGTAASGAAIRLYEDTDNGTNYIALQAPSDLPTNVTLTLPNNDGASNQVLTTDGAGVLSWTDSGGNISGAGGAIVINNTTVSTNYTIAAGTNGFSVGPITISSGYAITVSSGQRWAVI